MQRHVNTTERGGVQWTSFQVMNGALEFDTYEQLYFITNRTNLLPMWFRHLYTCLTKLTCEFLIRTDH